MLAIADANGPEAVRRFREQYTSEPVPDRHTVRQRAYQMIDSQVGSVPDRAFHLRIADTMDTFADLRLDQSPLAGESARRRRWSPDPGSAQDPPRARHLRQVDAPRVRPVWPPTRCSATFTKSAAFYAAKDYSSVFALVLVAHPG